MDTKVPVDENSVFEIGSITKTFTATILSQRALDGNMVLTNPVNDYLPTSVRAPSRNGKSITLQHLATHRSGLPRMPDNFTPTNDMNPYIDYPVQKMYDFLSTYQLPRDPGAGYEYSNLAFGLLGHVLEFQFATNYEAIVQQQVLQPLGMTDTAVRFTPSMQDHLARGHMGVVPQHSWDCSSAFAGAGALRAPARDLLKYVAANMGLVQTGLRAAMTNAHATRSSSASDYSLGLAWRIVPISGDRIIWHGGTTAGYDTFAGFLGSGKLGVVVLANGFYLLDDLGLQLLSSTKPLAAMRVPITLPQETLRSCVGRFALGTEDYFDIGLVHGYLTCEYSAPLYLGHTRSTRARPGGSSVRIAPRLSCFRLTTWESAPRFTARRTTKPTPGWPCRHNSPSRGVTAKPRSLLPVILGRIMSSKPPQI